jgi:hypothetical protein
MDRMASANGKKFLRVEELKEDINWLFQWTKTQKKNVWMTYLRRYFF